MRETTNISIQLVYRLSCDMTLATWEHRRCWYVRRKPSQSFLIQIPEAEGTNNTISRGLTIPLLTTPLVTIIREPLAMRRHSFSNHSRGRIRLIAVLPFFCTLTAWTLSDNWAARVQHMPSIPNRADFQPRAPDPRTEKNYPAPCLTRFLCVDAFLAVHVRARRVREG